MKKRKIISTLSILILALALSACAATARQDMSQPAPSTQGASSQEAAPSQVPGDDTGSQANADSKAEDQAADTALSMGTASEINNFGINVTKMEFKGRIDSSAYTTFKADEGNQFLIVSVYVENNAKKAQTFLPSFNMGDDVSTKVVYGDGFEYSSTQLLAYDSDMHDTTLNPLTSKSGIIAFQVPESIASSEDPLSLLFVCGSDSVEYNLR